MVRMQHKIGAFTIKIEVDADRYPYHYIVYVGDLEGIRKEEVAFRDYLSATLFIETDLKPGLESVVEKVVEME